MTGAATAPLGLLPAATRARIVSADSGDPPRRLRGRCGHTSENRSAQVGVLNKGVRPGRAEE